MDQALKSRILENKFVDQIRSWIIDRDAFTALCDDLKLLAREWRAVSLIDKELVAHLFLILTVTRNMADGLECNGYPEKAAQVRQLWAKLDNLVFEMFFVDQGG